MVSDQQHRTKADAKKRQGNGQMHGAPYCCHGYVPLRFGGGERHNEKWNTTTRLRKPVLQPWIRSAEVRGERRYENWNITTRPEKKSMCKKTQKINDLFQRKCDKRV